MQKARFGAMILTVGLMVLFLSACAGSENAPRLDRNTLKSWLSDPQVIILDVRSPHDWTGSNKKILNAVRQDPREVKTWGPGLPKDKKIVLYCA